MEQAASMVEGFHLEELTASHVIGSDTEDRPDPIPESQAEINRQADAAIRDLFPRIPNTDREMIVQHAFQKVRDLGYRPSVS